MSYLKSKQLALSCPPLYVSVLIWPWVTYWPRSARFRACSLVRFRTCPASVGPFARVRAHFLLRLWSDPWQIETNHVSPVLWFQRWQYTYPYTRTSNRLNNKDSFLLLSPSSPSFSFITLFVKCNHHFFVSGFLLSVHLAPLSTPAVELCPSFPQATLSR